MTEQPTEPGVLKNAAPIAVGAEPLDPISDVEAKTSKNYSRVGSIRPSAMLYTNGIGATVDLPHFAVMPSGSDAWERVYARRPGGAETIAEPRLLELTRGHLGSQVTELRKPPWAPEEKGWATGSATDLGIPCRIFPQWLRCTGCGLLAPVSHERFSYKNTSRYRPDRAEFIHERCRGFDGSKKAFNAIALPARYLIACVNGHLDEFPYDAWVHRGLTCSSGNPFPELRMREWKSNIGPDVQVHCLACSQSRGMLEAVGTKSADKLPNCRGRHPHLDAFYKCGQAGRLMMLGSANQWFPSTLGLLALPREEATSVADLVPLLRMMPKGDLDELDGIVEMKVFRKLAAMAASTDAFDAVSDEMLWEAVQIARGSAAPAAVSAERQSDPRTILAPEWAVLTDRAKYTRLSGTRDFRAIHQDVAAPLHPLLSAVVAVEKLKKVNAFIGFTRIDALDRIDDAANRVAPLCANGKPTWVPATEDRGEGIFLQFDESVMASWEQQVLGLAVWDAFRRAHWLNFQRRTSKTADDINPDVRFPAPRYWAIHTLSHLLIREAAMSSGYGSASLTERIYAWPDGEGHSAAAGLLISTTASDGEGTLGGLVELAKPAKLLHLFENALRRGARCSSDPICSHRAPRGKEEFLHGAACHFCLFVSETSCERTNRFLDRRLLLGLLTDPDVKTPGLLDGLSILQ
ncbi:DUF1998 domain-containing protein [Mycolicibacterium sp. P9-22]|uniref:DUF1998 domain-containing protein n=1 Tax=Mycolicibacterium sp. P9-22 TaxID=2024613 RepID=UPI0011F016A3|nr:DUF1998 domain-containing protein [Mycolicibacterium sp. P9-22]KAA0115090.1 DUF1998 domain-containing protein [Mycolicibacterium sp. P9-22]